MCGICGFAAGREITADEKAQAVAELMVSWIRTTTYGTDAAGLFTISGDNRGPGFAIKTPGSASEIVGTTGKKLMELESRRPLVVAHTRKATAGTAEDNRNNHPFMVGSLVGVHNGVFPSHRKYRDVVKPDGDCDSEVLFRLLDLLRPKRPYEQTLNLLDGYSRVAFYDHDDRKLRVYTSDGNAMYLAHDRTLGVTWFGTDPECFPDRLTALWKPVKRRRTVVIANRDPDGADTKAEGASVGVDVETRTMPAV